MEAYKHERECGYRAQLVVKTLTATRGRDFPLARLAEPLRCPRCGAVLCCAVLFEPANELRVHGEPCLNFAQKLLTFYLIEDRHGTSVGPGCCLCPSLSQFDEALTIALGPGLFREAHTLCGVLTIKLRI
jgi:hypothetical protein